MDTINNKLDNSQDSSTSFDNTSDSLNNSNSNNKNSEIEYSSVDSIFYMQNNILDKFSIDSRRDSIRIINQQLEECEKNLNYVSTVNKNKSDKIYDCLNDWNMKIEKSEKEVYTYL